MKLLDLPSDLLVEISSALICNPPVFELDKVSRPFAMWEVPDLTDVHNTALTCKILRDLTQFLRFRYVLCVSWTSIQRVDNYLELHPEVSGMVRYLYLRRPGFLETQTRLLVERLLKRLHSLEAFQAAFRGYLDGASLSALSTSPDLRHIWLDCDMIQTDPIPSFAELRLTSLHLGILKLHHDSERDIHPLHDILLGQTQHTLKNLELRCFAGGAIDVGEMTLSQFLPKQLNLPVLEILSLTGKVRVDANLLEILSIGLPKLKILNSGTAIANAIDYFGRGTWSSLEKLHLAHFVSLGTSDDNIAHEQVVTKAVNVSELRIGNLPVPGALRIFGRGISCAPLRNLRVVTIYIQLFSRYYSIAPRDFIPIFEGLPNVESLTILSASYGASAHRKNWSTDMRPFASALSGESILYLPTSCVNVSESIIGLRHLRELELDPALFEDRTDLIPNGDLDSSETIDWRERHKEVYKSNTAVLKSRCPSLRQVIWGFGFPFIIWRGDVSSSIMEGDNPKVEITLERR